MSNTSFLGKMEFFNVWWMWGIKVFCQPIFENSNGPFGNFTFSSSFGFFYFLCCSLVSWRFRIFIFSTFFWIWLRRWLFSEWRKNFQVLEKFSLRVRDSFESSFLWHFRQIVWYKNWAKYDKVDSFPTWFLYPQLLYMHKSWNISLLSIQFSLLEPSFKLNF